MSELVWIVFGAVYVLAAVLVVLPTILDNGGSLPLAFLLALTWPLWVIPAAFAYWLVSKVRSTRRKAGRGDHIRFDGPAD